MNHLDEEEIRLKQTEEALDLYHKIADIFIKEKTTIEMSYTVLSSMADSLYAYMVMQNYEEDEE